MLPQIKLLASLPNPLVVDEVLYICTMHGDAIHEARRLETTMFCFDCDKSLPDERCPDHPNNVPTYIVQKKVSVPLVEAPRFRRVAHFDRNGVAFAAPQVDYLEVAYMVQEGFTGPGNAAPHFNGKFVVISSESAERLGPTKAVYELDEYELKPEVWDKQPSDMRTGSYVPMEFVQVILKSWQATGDENDFNKGIAIEWLNVPLSAGVVSSNQQTLGF